MKPAAYLWITPVLDEERKAHVTVALGMVCRRDTLIVSVQRICTDGKKA